VLSLRHPMMYFAVHKIIANLLSLRDIGDFPVVFITSPGVIGEAFRIFLGTKKKHFEAGTYVGTNKRTVTIWGKANPMTQFVRSVVKNNKQKMNEVYQKTGMTHIAQMGLRKKKWDLLRLLEKE